MGDAAGDDMTTLAVQLASTDVGQRAAAAERLAQAGETAAPAAVALVTACGDADERIREWAVAALEELGPPPVEAVGPLVTLARNADPLTAYWAVTLLGRSGKDAAAAAKVLADCLDASVDLAVRQRAAWAIAQIGPAAAAARPAVERAATADDPRLARLAVEAVAALDGKGA